MSWSVKVFLYSLSQNLYTLACLLRVPHNLCFVVWWSWSRLNFILWLFQTFCSLYLFSHFHLNNADINQNILLRFEVFGTIEIETSAGIQVLTWCWLVVQTFCALRGYSTVSIYQSARRNIPEDWIFIWITVPGMWRRVVSKDMRSPFAG